jgi:hypothetical protein
MGTLEMSVASWSASRVTDALRPRLPDALFECGVEIEYRLEGNLNHVTVIHTVM